VRWLVLLDPPLDPELRNPEIDPVYRLRHAPPGELEAYLLDANPGGGQLLAQSLARFVPPGQRRRLRSLLAATRRQAQCAEALAQAPRIRALPRAPADPAMAACWATPPPGRLCSGSRTDT